MDPTNVGLLKGADGKPSTMRFASLLIIAVVMFVWGFICVRKLELVPLGSNEVWLVGLALTGKAAQRYIEGKNVCT